MVATDIRKNARKALKGKWNKGAIIAFIVILVSVGINLLAWKLQENVILVNVISAIYVLIGVPLSIGVVYGFLELKRKKDSKIFDFLKLTFKNFAKSWALSWMIILKMILPIICVAVAIILYATLMFTSNEISFGFMLLGVAVFMAAIVYAVVIGLLYVLAYYIAYDHPEMGIRQVVNESARLMRGHRGDYFVLMLSFLGWAILCVLTVGVGFIWLAPYMQTAMICFYEEVIKLDKKSKKETKTEKVEETKEDNKE